MKKTFLCSLSLVWMITVFWSQNATLADFALVFEKQEESRPLAILPPGVGVNLITTNGMWSFIEGYSFKGWTKAPLITLPREWKLTQEQPLLLSPRLILEDVPLALWIYNNQLWWYDVENRKVVKKDNFDTLSSVYGLYRERWLVGDKIYTDGQKEKPLSLREVWLYDIQTKKKIKIGIFDNQTLWFDDISISSDSRYAVIRLGSKKNSYTYLWDLNTLQWVGWVTNISQTRWVGNTQILFRENHALFVSELTSWLNAKGNVEKNPISLPKGLQRFSSYRVENTTLYLLSDKKVYQGDITGTNWKLTDLRSLEWNADKTLNVYVDAAGGHLYDVQNKKLFREFSGENPEKEFIAFTLDGLLVQQSFAKIPTLFLFSSDMNEVYRYKAVDKIHAMDGNGTLLEVVNEGGVLLLIVERPHKGYYFVFPERL
ncbi:MAG: hypothetical protein N2314_01960 [Brevinematales bacterium]|nr:hypothetical protein [Brevinematales bacterium]